MYYVLFISLFGPHSKFVNFSRYSLTTTKKSIKISQAVFSWKEGKNRFQRNQAILGLFLKRRNFE